MAKGPNDEAHHRADHDAAAAAVHPHGGLCALRVSLPHKVPHQKAGELLRSFSALHPRTGSAVYG